jgi:hypothetical protein
MGRDADREPHEHPAGIIGTLLTIAETIRDWRQLAILLILGFCTLIGIVIYQARDRLVAGLDTFMTTPTPVKLASRSTLQDLADHLYDQLTPTAGVVIYSIDMPHNRRVIMAVHLDPEIQKALPFVKPGRLTPLLTRASPEANLLTIKVLDGETPCGVPPRGLWETQTGGPAPNPDVPDLIKEVCLVGIPPTTDAFVGMIGVGFQKLLAPAREGVVAATLRTMAEQGIK